MAAKIYSLWTKKMNLPIITWIWFVSLKPYWYESQIKCDPPPKKKMAIFFFLGGGGGRLFGYFDDVMVGFYSKFLVKILGKRIFLTEFSADRPKFRPQTHKWNFKNLRFLEFFFTFSVFFFQIGSKHRHESQKSKKNFQS